MFNNQSNPLHVKNGGLIGLAGTAIALGVEVAPYMDKFMEQLLRCFSDPENRIRYFSAECLYNVAKVAKGEILVHFNDIFDALSKVRLCAPTHIVAAAINHSIFINSSQQTRNCLSRTVLSC